MPSLRVLAGCNADYTSAKVVLAMLFIAAMTILCVLPAVALPSGPTPVDAMDSSSRARSAQCWWRRLQIVERQGNL
jgi:hypothetical protein